MEHNIFQSAIEQPGSDTVCVAVCDDEQFMCDMLEEKIKKELPDAAVLKFISGKELLDSAIWPDILFLDIQMPEMDGMETARFIRRRQKNLLIIFITAVEEYVFQAFDVGAFHYLVKPFSDAAARTKGVDKTYNKNGAHSDTLSKLFSSTVDEKVGDKDKDKNDDKYSWKSKIEKEKDKED